MTFGVSIPAYTNEESLRRCLSSVLKAAPEISRNLVIVDDGGSGKVAGALREEFAGATWIVHSTNFGFGPSANEAVLANTADVVILLNDDVELLSNPVPSLRRVFETAQLFAVTFKSVNEHGAFREGAKRLVWRMGFPRILHNERDQTALRNGIQLSSYAVGGHAAFDRCKFAALHGFDPLYAPFYWEDVDLSQRALARGWETIYSAECLVSHAGPSSIRNSQMADRIREITLRNRVLFAWRHATSSQRALLKFNLKWQRTAARLRGDSVKVRALDTAKVRWEEFESNGESGSPLASTSGVTLGQ